METIIPSYCTGSVPFLLSCLSCDGRRKHSVYGEVVRCEFVFQWRLDVKCVLVSVWVGFM